MDDLKDAIKQLLKESEKYSDNAAAGYMRVGIMEKRMLITMY